MRQKTTQIVPCINTDIALQRLNGDTALLATLAGFFLEDAPQLLDDLHEGLRKNSLRQITESAHRLRGLASSFEAGPVMKLTAQIETLTATQEYERMQDLTEQLDFEFARLVAKLHDLAQ
jgi:HPt (histidine-containing phosphotransfer) domain-containing protein